MTILYLARTKYNCYRKKIKKTKKKENVNDYQYLKLNTLNFIPGTNKFHEKKVNDFCIES